MKKIKKGLLFVLTYFGIYPEQFFQNVVSISSYLKERRAFKADFRTKYQNWKFSWYPILTDRKEQSGKARGQYFYQDLHVASMIFKANPDRHVDVGSRIDGFIAHLATFREVDVLDIRPLKNDIQNVNFVQADLMKPMDGFHESTDSLSCLHTIEHFGLGRYGDPIDVDGHIKGLDSLHQILKTNGLFYFSTQIGSPKVAFNAHRVFGLPYLLDLFEKQYTLENFSFIDDSDKLHTNVSLTPDMIQKHCNCKLGCGIFVLRKK